MERPRGGPRRRQEGRRCGSLQVVHRSRVVSIADRGISYPPADVRWLQVIAAIWASCHRHEGGSRPGTPDPSGGASPHAQHHAQGRRPLSLLHQNRDAAY
jgi:hypothetical protein